MSTWGLTLVTLVAIAVLYGVFIATLVVMGRREHARAIALLVGDFIVLSHRLLHDPRLPRRYKLLIGALFAYLVVPVDLVPDFIPIAGQLDDAIVAILVLRTLIRGAGPELARELWPGPVTSLTTVLRLAGLPSAAG